MARLPADVVTAEDRQIGEAGDRGGDDLLVEAAAETLSTTATCSSLWDVNTDNDIVATTACWA
jgi:hypothetical protein